MMKLIGMLDSPYVRRTAISLRAMGISFDHQALSVFNNFAEFQAINPVVKAPTFIFDSGEVLMDSTIILHYAESAVPASRRLMPASGEEFRLALQIIGFALAACEKAVQCVYEKNLRPVEKQHQPWIDRVSLQLKAACEGLEQKLTTSEYELAPAVLNQPFITAAVAWQFIQSMLPDIIPAAEYPRLQTLSSHAETLPEFLAFPPIGPGVVAPNP
ncbi:glutathione S-transferase [Cellvibrio zantedeschiae]|uniref:Glutathione S-transferase n=1 Tax=Cellvibrio zantedeschiae TaxID=1237077 RepID=A0ABQ3ANW4_9GAMM|nr:glutathione S-transferase [Cellvibrio zantedeschiae]GGY63232.1 glutathione S-transferase [Cellvibrio zantedeschiae]